MAPEQIRNASLADERSDVYGLGCILYAMIAGRPPFAGRVSAVIHAQRHAAPDAAGLHRAPYPLRALVLAMLAKDPDRRPASMAAVRDALRAIGAESAEGAALSLTERVSLPPGRARFALIGLAALLAVGAVVFLLTA